MIAGAPPSVQGLRKRPVSDSRRTGMPLEGGRAEAMHRYRPAVPPPREPSMIARDESQPIDSQMLVSAISCRIVLASPSCPGAAEIEGPT